MNYIVNVSFHGKHFFSTDPHSVDSLEMARVVGRTLKERFPQSEGWEITVNSHAIVGEDITKELGL